jgi:pimeloyl-ACP methyl ester carboxylesterase
MWLPDRPAMAELNLPTEQTLRVGGRLHGFCDAGGGAAMPLVLLHGIGSNAASWVEQLAALSGERLVVAWNAPGYGATAPLADPYPTADAYVAALVAFLDAKGVARCDLLGHSLGGLIAARCTVAHPGRVRRLLLSSPAGGYRHDPALALPDKLAARIDDVRKLGPAGMADRRAGNTLSGDAMPLARARVHAAMAAVSVDGYAQATWMLAQADIMADAAQLRVPTQVMVGSADRVTLPEGVRAIADAIPGAGFRLIEGAGHASYADRPDAYNAALASFLA